MDPQTQTIQLLKLLGEDTAEAVLARLEPTQAQALRNSMAAGGEVRLRRDRSMELIDQFDRFMDFALRAMPRSSEKDDAESPSDTPVAMKLSGDPVKDLIALSVYQIAGALETEQPRTVAILLGELPHELTAEVLSLLPTDHQGAVVRELAREHDAPRVLVDRIARATLQRGLSLPAEPPDRRHRLDRLSDVLRAVPKRLRRDMMDAIQQDDEEMSHALLKRLYRFEDITSLDGRLIQQILGEIDGTTLTTAMFQASDDVLEAILGNLSRRARQSIEEELTFQTQVPESRVDAAREAIAEVIARLDQDSE